MIAKNKHLSPLSLLRGVWPKKLNIIIWNRSFNVFFFSTPQGKSFPGTSYITCIIVFCLKITLKNTVKRMIKCFSLVNLYLMGFIVENNGWVMCLFCLLTILSWLNSMIKCRLHKAKCWVSWLGKTPFFSPWFFSSWPGCNMSWRQCVLTALLYSKKGLVTGCKLLI